MDEIHAVLELFVSCRGSGWPLVRLEAEQQLLTQHLLMAAPMDKEEIEDLIKKCFEADNNGEINFLSFWSGMENLLELLGIREPASHVDDKVYGLQIFRDGLLAEAINKHQGPTSSVLLSRDEVLRIIDQTNKAVTSRHSRENAEGTRRDEGSCQGGDSCASSLFWDEVYRETALLESNSVLSITELSMMVFGFLKSYLRQEPAGMKHSEGDPSSVGKAVEQEETEHAVHSDAWRIRSGVSDASCEPAAHAVAGIPAGLRHDEAVGQNVHRRISGSANRESGNVDGSYSPPMTHGRWQESGDREHLREHRKHLQDRAASRNDISSSTVGGCERGSEGQTYREVSESEHFDASHILKGIDSDDPFSQLRHLLIFAGEVVERGVVSKKDVQQLRHVNAAAVDCVDRILVERDKRNEEVNDAVLSLRRMRTEKQQLIERLTTVEHQHSQLQLQQEQQLCEREKAGQLQAALDSERQERERLRALLRDKEEHLMDVTHERDALLDKISSQNDEFNRLLEVAQKEKTDLNKDYRQQTETLMREKEMLEEKLRSAEDKAKTAEAARQQLQGEAHLSASALRQRILELEEDKKRQEAEAEENEALILQLQGRLEEKVQQVTILEVKNKQQARLLHQVRGVRNSLMQVLQESKETETVQGVPTTSVAASVREPEIMKLKAGMKAALAHIKDLECFIDEMRKEQRRGVHPRYEISAASGDSSARSLHSRQIDEPCRRPLRALPTLGDELEKLGGASEIGHGREVPGSAIKKGVGRETESSPSGEPDTPPHCEESRVAGEEASDEAGSPTSAANFEAPLSKQPSIREQIVTVEKQKAVASKVCGADPSRVRRPRTARAGTTGDAASFASLRSEPSTIDAVSKEPTSSASLPEVEDIFDPLDLLKSEDATEADAQESLAVNDRLSRTSHAAQRVLSADRTKPISSKSRPYLVHRSAADAARSSNASELPPSRVSPKMSDGHSFSSGGFEMPDGGRRCRSRATESDVSNEHQDGVIEPSMSVPSQEAGSALGGPRISSSRDKSDSLASFASEGKFLMLAAPSEAKKSPTASAGRRIEDRLHSSKTDLAPRGLGPSTLSGMFSMLGACAAVTGNAQRRPAGSTEAENGAIKNTRSAGGEESSKPKHKQPSRLSAAATAAISTKDVSEFRSLRRVSHVEPPEESSADRFTARTSGSTEKSDLTALRGDPASDESLLTGRDQWSKTSPSPKAGHARARRTVSLGITEMPDDIKGRDALEQPKAQLSVAAVVSSEGGKEHSGGKGHHLHDSEVARSPRASSSFPKGPPGTGIEKKLPSESGSPTSSLRNRAGVLAASETCRSIGDANTQRTPRSRSSSSEPPSGKASSSHGVPTNQQTREPKKPHETRNTEAQGQQQRSHSGSMAYQGTECEGQLQTLRRQVPSVEDQASQQDGLEQCDRVGLRTDGISEGRSGDKLRPNQLFPHDMKDECAKRQDEQAASAAALLAAAAGVVDASLQQHQQMIQRQQEHHEDLQRAQQRRIDMLQEQLEHLQKAKDEQRESGEQEQKKLIHALQSKLEELQKRQEQREQDFQDAQRKLQEELEVQLKQKLEELRCSPRRTNIEAGTSCSVGQNDIHASYSRRHDTDIRNNHGLRAGYQHAASGGTNSFENNTGEQALLPHPMQENGGKRLPDVHPFTAVSENFAGVNAKRLNQFPSSGKMEDGTLNTMPWHRGGKEPQGCAGRMGLHNAATDSQGQPTTDASGGYMCGNNDRCSDSDDASSCASSSLMGSQCGVPTNSCSFEDAPTATSSSFISQSTTPAVCSSAPSQRGNYLASEGQSDRQMYAAGGDRLVSQSIGTHRRENVLRRNNIPNSQSSEPISATPQYVPINAGQADPLLPPRVVHRISSSTDSLWSPKASKNHAAGMGERAPCCSTACTSRPHAYSSANSSAGTTTLSAGYRAGSQEKLLRGEFGYCSGSPHHPPDQDPGPRGSVAGSGRHQMSVYHPVSRAERIMSVQNAPIDSARFLGNSSTPERAASLSGISKGPPGSFPSRDSHMPAPLSSARSIASTSSLAFPLQGSSLSHTSRLLQQPMNASQCKPPSTDFLGATSARSSTTHRHTDSRSSQDSGTKRSRHGRCSETQVSPSPGHARNDPAVRSTRSSGVSTRRDSLLSGPRRTVSSLMSKQPRSTTSEVNCPGPRGKAHSCTAGTLSTGCAPIESIAGERFEGSDTTPIMYRRASSSATLPDAELSRYPSHHRQNAHHGSSRKDKQDDKRQHNGPQPAELSAAGESSNSTTPSSGWGGFNGGFMSQVQRWIS